MTSVWMFQYHVESFFTHYILDDSNPVGKVKEYAIKIEFQEHGSPHAHCLLWVDGAPHIDVDNDDEVCSFINTYVSGMIPDNSDENKHTAKMVKKYETHVHSNYCRWNRSCHFGFPKPPSPCTIICREPEDNDHRENTLKNACDILSKVYEIIEGSSETLNLDDVLQAAGITEQEYLRALKVTHQGRSVILKCNPSDSFTNGCNHNILLLWSANVDFQFVLDEYSTIIYICSYMMKSEKAMGEVLKSVAKECWSEPIKQQLKKIRKAFVGNRVFGAPEAAMRELSMWLMKKSRKVTFVDSNMCDDHVSLPKPGNTLNHMDDDEENIYMTSVHDRYAACPNCIENMCLAKFAVTFEPKYDSSANNDNDNDEHIFEDENDNDIEDNEQHRINDKVIMLKNNLGQMHKRKQESILQVKSFKQNTDPEKYYHSHLTL